MAIQPKRCGDCQRWGKVGDEIDGARPCMWPKPVLPFWAEGALDEPGDHDDWTMPDQGRNCRAFERKEEADG